MKRKILWIGLSFLVVAALVLSSCAKEVVTPGEQEEEEEEEEVAAGEEEEEVVVPEAGEPIYGGTLSVQMMYHWSYTFPSFDFVEPAMCTYHWLGDTCEHMLDGDIFSEKARGGTNDFTYRVQEWIPNDQLTGCLAETWEVAENPLRIIFHIRHGVMWQNKPPLNIDREFTAYDAEFCYKRLFADPATGAPGLRPMLSPEGPDCVTATDKYTLEITLKYWDPERFMIPLSGWETNMYPPEVVDAGAEDWRNVVGTGPWMLMDYVKGSYFKFDRNPTYWKWITINGKEYQLPFADHLVGPVIADESTQIAALRTGKLDFMEKVPIKYKDSLLGTCPELVAYPQMGLTLYHVAMRMDTAPFNEIKVRQAMNVAVDRTALMKAIYTEGCIDNCPVFSLMPYPSYYTPIDELPAEAKAMYEYSTEKAKQLLADGGYPDGFDTEIVTRSDLPELADTAALLVDYWADIGINCKIVGLDQSGYSAIRFAHDYPQMILSSGMCAPPLEDMANYTTKGVEHNDSMVDDPWFTSEIERCSAMVPGDERQALMRELTYYYTSQAFYVNLPSGNYYTMHWPWIKNYYGEVDEGCYRQCWIVASMWIDQDLKTEMGFK